MPLLARSPEVFPPDLSSRRVVLFESPADRQSQQVTVYSPALIGEDPLPLVIAPHPMTWTADMDYCGGPEELKRGFHSGWRGMADRFRVMIAMPHGHHRRVDLCSLASPEQIMDLASLPDVLVRQGFPVNRRRVYACGLSMGGLEALVFAGCHPEILSAVVAFNPIVDLKAWYEDMAATSVLEFRENGTARAIAEEVGGLPQDIPEDYAERSATSYVDGLSKVPTLLFWSERDLVIPRQETHHAYRLYRQVKARSATSPIAEYNHTRIHGLSSYDEKTCWRLHEWCDYELALHWLLQHQRPI